MPICFRDMTFCGSDCTNSGCNRNLTPDLQSRARDWWNGMPGEPPIAFAALHLSCDQYQPPSSCVEPPDAS